MPEPPVLADSNVWIEYFRRRNPRVEGALDALIDELRLSIAPPVVAELLGGARGEAEIRQAEELLETFPIVEVATRDWIEAGRLFREVRRAGQGVPMMDCLLAAAAVRSGHMFWSLDADFDRLEKLGLERFQLPA